MELSTGPSVVRGETIGETWLKCVAQVLQYGVPAHDEDVEIIELLGLSLNVAKPHWHDPIIEALGDPRVCARMLAKFSKGVSMPDRSFTYGERIYAMSGIDQFEWLIHRLRSKRETKSATIGLLVPGSDAANPPCLTTLDAKIRKDQLELQFFFRSQNIFGRQYANLLALAKLQADLATRCEVTPGGLRGYVASAHIYAFDVPQARELLSGGHVAIRDQYYVSGPLSVRSR